MPRQRISDRVQEWVRSRPITEAEIKAAFADLPDDKLDRKYERRITAWAIQQARPEDFKTLGAALQKLAADESISPSHRFDAFFALANLYRRYSKVDALESLIRTYRQSFDPAYDPLISHLEIMYLHLRGGKESYVEALEKAEAIWNQGGWKHAGFYHNYADTIAMCVEKGYCSWDETLLRKALHAANEAIRLDPDYGKFYRTLGFLYFLLGDAEQGRRSYRAAIEQEDPEGRDYGLRLAEYRRELALREAHLEVQQLKEELTSEHQDLTELKRELLELTQTLRVEQGRADTLHATVADVKATADNIQKTVSEVATRAGNVEKIAGEMEARQQDLQTRQLEFLGFFTGILALILGGGGLLVTAQSDATRFVLMLTLGGLLLLVFGSFNFMLHGKTRLERSLVPMVLGFLLLLGSGLWLFWQG